MIDNYDSFTYNLVHYLQKLEFDVQVRRNDEITLNDIEAIAPSHIVISPGPGRPENAGISREVIEKFQGQIPILGVCLGHQAIGEAFGGHIVNAKRIMHGKTSPIFHNNRGIFNGLPQGFSATRYHSLVIDETRLPDCLEITAWTQSEGGERRHIMGIRHRQLPLEGVQFHPESVLSEHGLALLSHFLQD